MSLSELIATVWRRKLAALLVAAVLIVVGCASLLVRHHTTYTSRAQIAIDQPDLVGNLGGGSVPGKIAQLIPTMCRLLGADDVVRAIEAEATVNRGKVTGGTLCSAIPGTEVILVSAKSRDAGVSRQLAQTSATVLARTITQRYSGPLVPVRENVRADVITAARRPGPDPNRLPRQIGLVVAGSLIFAIAVVIGLEPHRRVWMRDLNGDYWVDERRPEPQPRG